MLIYSSIKAQIIKTEVNFILTEIQIEMKPVRIGAIYVPFPQKIFDEIKKQTFYIFGDTADFSFLLFTN